jgi:hypothetical protein
MFTVVHVVGFSNGYFLAPTEQTKPKSRLFRLLGKHEFHWKHRGVYRVLMGRLFTIVHFGTPTPSLPLEN